MLEGSQGTDAYARARCALDRLYISSDAAPSCSCSCGGSWEPMAREWDSGCTGRGESSRAAASVPCARHGACGANILVVSMVIVT